MVFVLIVYALAAWRDRAAGGAAAAVAARRARHRHVVARGKDRRAWSGRARPSATRPTTRRSCSSTMCARRSAGWSRSTTSASIVSRGEILGLIGPNGSGKTTVLNLISGALTPDSGEIRLDGARSRAAPRIASRSAASRARSSSCACSAHRPAVENVIAGLAFHAPPLWGAEADAPRPRAARARRARPTRPTCRPANSPISTRSGSSLRARWRSTPDVLLLDEWLAGLNPSELQRRHRAGEDRCARKASPSSSSSM